MRGVRVAEQTDDRGAAREPARSRSTIAMDTVVTASVESTRPQQEIEAALQQGLAWFGVVERVCSRFDPESELVRLCRQPGKPVVVSPLLFEAVAFAIEVAKATNGAFDPTVGGVQQSRGLSRNYVTGAELKLESEPASYHDVHLDARARTVVLLKPLLLDLGALAKGLAIDLAAKELSGLERFAVEAGGDLYAGGAARPSRPWRIGVQDPAADGLLGTLSVWNRAVCTSGDYERGLEDGEHHLLDPHRGRSPRALRSVTAIASSAMVADALSTAAFVLGPVKGLALLRGHQAEGIIVGADGAVRTTPGCAKALAWSRLQT